MKFTKILSLVLALLIMSFCFAACSDSDNKDPKDTEKQTQNNENNDKPKLTLATNAEFPPYEYYDDSEKIVGIDVEIAEKIAKKLGMTLEIIDTDFDSIVPSIKAGKYDIGMAGMTVEPDRLEEVNFTKSYATGVQVVIVKEDSEIKSLEDLDKGGFKIGAQLGTTGYIYAGDDYGEKSEVMGYNKGADAVEALVNNKIDCVIIDNEPAKAFISAKEGLKILETAYAIEDYAIAVKKENTELLGKLDKAIEELIEDGTIKNILDKYIGD